MAKKTVRNNILLVLTALIWGISFVAQSVGVEYVGPFTFMFSRSILGGVFLLIVIFFMDRITGNKKKEDKKQLILGGISCGIALFGAGILQQLGLMYTTVGKGGFITALYIIIVPLLGIFIGKAVQKKVWISVGLAAAGMYLLCINEDFSIGTGDILVFLCAIGFAIHILVIDHFADKADGVKMSCIQFFTCSLLHFIGMILFEEPSIRAIGSAWLPIFYAGVCSYGIAHTLQIVAQDGTDPTVASLLLSLESVFAVLAGWLLLGETLTLKEFIGCVLVFAAIILAQLPEDWKIKVKRHE